MVRSTGFKLYGTKTFLRSNGVFYLLTQRTYSTRLIESECSGRSDTYDRTELVLSSTAIVDGHRSFFVTVMGRTVFYIVKGA